MFTTVFFIGYFSLIRGPQHGAIMEAENNNMYNAAIEIINLWRKMEASRETEAGLYMRQV